MFSFAERLVLFNQYEILKNLDPEKSSMYARHQEVVEKGLESLYGELGISETTVSEETAEEVSNILQMFQAIKKSSNGVSNNIADRTKFVGFGPSQSSAHFSYADFLSRVLKLPQEISKSADNRPELQLEKYRTMLKRWDEIGRRHKLSADQIAHLVA